MAQYNPVDLVQPAYREDFLRFVETGEADDSFFDYLEKDEDAQKAVDIVYERQVKAFETLAKLLSESATNSLERKLHK